MHFDLVDTLRCIVPHEESWLVAAADRTAGRRIMEGLLGCPVCRARYPISDGVADFTAGAALPAPGAALHLEEGDVVKLAAMLDLTDARGYVLLLGEWARLAAGLRELVPVSVLVANAPAGLAADEGVSAIVTAERIPVAAASARALAIDAAIPQLVPSAIAAVRSGGRVVGTAAAAPPGDVELVARDDRHWVGTRRGGGPLLRLVRGGPG